MVLSNDFTCPKGHKFVANAKLRARCPECGSMARRAFGEPKVEKKEGENKSSIGERLESDGVNPEAKIESSKEGKAEEKPRKQVKILKQGKTREPSKVAVHMASKKQVLKTGLIKHKKVSHKAIPSVNLKPRGNREHKIQPGGKDRPFWHDVADKYGL